MQRPVTERVERQIEERRVRWVPQEMVRQVPVTTFKTVQEERVEQIPVKTQKMVAEYHTVQVPRQQSNWVEETTIQRVPRRIMYKIPIGGSVDGGTVITPVADSSVVVDETVPNPLYPIEYPIEYPTESSTVSEPIISSPSTEQPSNRKRPTLEKSDGWNRVEEDRDARRPTTTQQAGKKLKWRSVAPFEVTRKSDSDSNAAARK